MPNYGKNPLLEEVELKRESIYNRKEHQPLGNYMLI
jgi:hypothetical protein